MSKYFVHVSSFVPTLSDCHCKLEWEISANYCVSGELDVPIKTYDISPNFIWSDDSATEFQCALLSNQIQNCISKFNNIQIQQNQTSVDDAAAELSNIFISAATMSLKRRFKKITDKPKIRNGLMQIYIKEGENCLIMGKYIQHFQKTL